MPNAVARTVPIVVQQHAEESVSLCRVRAVLVQAPHVRLHQLRRLDERLAAHLDGLVVAGAAGRRQCEAALAEAGPGEVFAAVMHAIETGDTARLDALMALGEAEPTLGEGVVLALGWASAQSLRGLIRDMLDAPNAFRRVAAIEGCAWHRVDPGAVLAAAIGDADAALRARALQAAGTCGRRDLLGACVAALGDADAECRFEAARAALLLGNRHAAVEVLHGLAAEAGPHRGAALGLLLKVLAPSQTAALLRILFAEDAGVRALVRAIGIAGDARLVPWLIECMANPKLARLAGEAFSLTTGADLAMLDLECRPPERVEAGPDQDPEKVDVALDEDEGLPWPDPPKVEQWWGVHAHRFPPGTICFMGNAPSVAHCRQVQRGGFQRQRIAAADYLCLLQPGTPVFPTSAPAWRQERWLGATDA